MTNNKITPNSKSILTNFWQFIKHPTDEQMSVSFGYKAKIIGIFLLIDLIVTFPLMKLVDPFIDLFITIDTANTETLQEAMILSVIFAPIAEEILFRFALRYRNFFKKLGLSRTTWNKIFPLAVYFITIYFGISHIDNFPDNNSLAFYLLAPLITLPQLVFGFMAIFLRVRFSFIWAVIMHALSNTVASLIPFMLFLPNIDYNITTDSYKLDSQRIFSYQADKDTYFTAKVTEDGKIKQLNTEQYLLTAVLEGLTERDFAGYDSLVDIQFKSENGIDIDEFVDIMLQEHKVKDIGEKPLEELIIETDSYSLTLHERGFTDLTNKLDTELKTSNDKVIKITARNIPLYSVLYNVTGQKYDFLNFDYEDMLIDIEFESKEGITTEEFVKLIQTKFDVVEY